MLPDSDFFFIVSSFFVPFPHFSIKNVENEDLKKNGGKMKNKGKMKNEENHSLI